MLIQSSFSYNSCSISLVHELPAHWGFSGYKIGKRNRIMVSLCNAPTRDAGHRRDGLSPGKKPGQEQRQEAGSWLQGMTCCRAKPRQCRREQLGKALLPARGEMETKGSGSGCQRAARASLWRMASPRTVHGKAQQGHCSSVPAQDEQIWQQQWESATTR